MNSEMNDEWVGDEYMMRLMKRCEPQTSYNPVFHFLNKAKVICPYLRCLYENYTAPVKGGSHDSQKLCVCKACLMDRRHLPCVRKAFDFLTEMQLVASFDLHRQSFSIWRTL